MTTTAGQITDSPRPARHFVGPVADFFLLGGASWIALLMAAVLWPPDVDTLPTAAAAMLVAHAINHPHFAHSYQLFYRDFLGRAFGDSFPPALRRRYLLAGIVVPFALAASATWCIATQNLEALGVGANIMGFLVGWHYVKQGYGLLIADSVLKRSFFSDTAKRRLLWNAYAVWIVSWLLINRAFARRDYWGIPFESIPVPDALLWAAVIAMCATTLLVLIELGAHARRHRDLPLPINGVVAYFSGLYVWLLVRHPIAVLIVPAFHSLQYLAVVWRCRINAERTGTTLIGRLTTRNTWLGLAAFTSSGVLLGYAGFWLVPEWLDRNIAYDRQLFGTTLFLFVSWIFINVHHYCMDNVIWRKDNPDTRAHLFASPQP